MESLAWEMVVKKTGKQWGSGLALLAAHARPDLLSFMQKRVNDQRIAEDLVQDSFLKFAEGGYDPVAANARPVLFGIAKNLLFDRLRKLRRERDLGLTGSGADMDNLHLLPSEAPSPEYMAEISQEFATVAQIVKAMPKRPRQVFTLSRMYGLTHQEIADRLGISRSMVEKHIMDAMSRFLQAMRHNGKKRG